MGDVRFTGIMVIQDPDPDGLRDSIRALDSLDYSNYEIYILSMIGERKTMTADVSPSDPFARIIRSVSRRDNIHYMQMGYEATPGQCINEGIRRSEGDYIFFIGQCDILSPEYLKKMEEKIVSSLLPKRPEELSIDDIARAASGNILRAWRDTAPDLIYSDHDELVSGIRMNPHFKGAFNRELLIQSDYIGPAFSVSRRLLKLTGLINENAGRACLYDYLLCILTLMMKGTEVKTDHICSLLYHKRIRELPDSVRDTLRKDIYKDYVSAAKRFIQKNGIKGRIKNDSSMRYWKLVRGSRDVKTHSSSYIFLRDKDISLRSGYAMEHLFSYLDGTVAAAVPLCLDDKSLIDNCGYLYDEKGNLYGACHSQSPADPGYEGRIALSSDISCADPGCCMLDAAIYKKLRGFMRGLGKNEMMLDYCLRARAAGFRIVYVSSVRVTRKGKADVSSTGSKDLIMKMYGPNGTSKHIRLAPGDPYYNPNLPMGIDNYRF